MDDNPICLFREVQYSRQWWLCAVILGSAIVTIGVIGAALFGLLPAHGTDADRPLSDVALMAAFALVVVLEFGVCWLFFASHMVTEVRPDGLYIRYFPFHRRFRQIRLTGTGNVAAVKYSPLGDYGGWGIRGSAKARAYNPTGDRGVRIDYDDGSHVLIGSGKPEELLSAINMILG